MSKLYQTDTISSLPSPASAHYFQHRKSIECVSPNSILSTKPHSKLTQNNEKSPSHLKPYKNKKIHSVSINKHRTHLNGFSKDQFISLSFINKSLYSLPVSIYEKASILQILDLSHNHLEYFPLEITQIVCLATLKLNQNKIKSLPSEIYKLSNLEYFSICQNKIQTLPPTFRQLSRLKELNLEANLIKEFGGEITDLHHLERLNIYQNRIKYLPVCFSNLRDLWEFRFEWVRYIDPSSNCYLKDEEGVENAIVKIRAACKALVNQNIKSLSFRDFLRIFSEEHEEPQLMGIDTYGCSLLHLACLYEDISVIKHLMIEAPALLDLPNSFGLTPFCFSVLKEKQGSSYYLLKHGANPTKGSPTEGDPIHIATRRLNIEIVKGILRLGVSPNKADPEGNTPLHYAVALLSENLPRAAEVIQCLIDYGADVNAKNKDGWSPIHIATRRRDVRAIEWTFDYNTETEEIHGRSEVFMMELGGGNYNWTPLHIAAYSDASGIIKVLGERGVSMFEQSMNGYTAKRLISAPGVSLKLIEKYEKEWIKKNVLNKKPSIAQEEVLYARKLENVSQRNIIQNASKNIFGDNANLEDEMCEDFEEVYMFRDSPYEEEAKPCIVNRTLAKNIGRSMESSFTMRLSTRARMSKPLTEPNECKVVQNCKFSFEVLPETENNTVNHSLEDVNETHPDFCGLEVNENVNIDASVYNQKDTKFLPPLDMKNRLSNALAKISRRNNSPDSSCSEESEGSFKEETLRILQIDDVLDLEKQSKKLSFATRLGIDFFREQMLSLGQTIIKNEVSLVEKMRILSVFSLAYIIASDESYVLSSPNGSHKRNVSSRSGRSHTERTGNIRKSSRENRLKNKALGKKEDFLQLISDTLISLFAGLQLDLNESDIIKKQICRMLAKKSYPGVLKFLERVSKDEQENFSVKFEAIQSLKILKSKKNTQMTKIGTLLALRYKQF